ncbi:MAG: hypothetical protein JSR66_17405 [Proteobacteria bacterium]|nr:hypothetical protein [Pseudomonadota bacterium]
MNVRRLNVSVVLLLAYAVLASALVCAATPATHGKTTAHVKKSRFPSGGMPASARGYYAIKYGVDQMSAKLTESGQLVRFSYRVIDAKKAAQLQDRGATPNMLAARARVALQVPTMEKVGPLRQAMGAETGKAYWIAFSNKGFPVKQGDEVSVTIGTFRADGLIVQ